MYDDVIFKKEQPSLFSGLFVGIVCGSALINLNEMSAEAGTGLEPQRKEGAPPEGPPGQRNPQQAAASKRLQHTQAQVDEVVGIMRTNVEKVLERDQKLSELDDRADALQQGASQFEQQAGKLKRKFWWKNCKMIAIMVGIGVVIVVIIMWAILIAIGVVIIIIIVVAVETNKSGSNPVV